MTETLPQESDDLSDLEHVLVDVDEDGIALVTISRPEALNALNEEVLSEIREAVIELAVDQDVRGLVITGAGEKAFVAGADIAAMADLTPREAREMSHDGQDCFSVLEACPKPVIAAINGFALGGGLELALACHLRVASESAQMGLPEVTLGLIPGFGGTQRLSRIASPAIAREWILTGDMVSAAEAHRVGVVNRVVAPGVVVEEAKKLAKTIASRGPVAVQAALEVIRMGLEMGQAAGESCEADAFGMMFSTEDMREGTKAFLAKRSPEFQGR